MCPFWGGMSKHKSRSAEDRLARSALPRILFDRDLALALDLPVEEARDLRRRGLLGPHGEIQGRAYILRDDLLAALADRSGGSDLPPAIRRLFGEAP